MSELTKVLSESELINKNLLEDSKKNLVIMGRNTQISIEDMDEQHHQIISKAKNTTETILFSISSCTNGLPSSVVAFAPIEASKSS